MGERMRLFMIYSAGNFIECTTDTPYLQIGEHKYGKPVLDRAITYEMDLYDALKVGLVSIDSTMRSNLSVGMPIDLLVVRRDTCEAELIYRIEPGEPYFTDLRERWSAALRAAHIGIPRPPYGRSAAARTSSAVCANRVRLLRKIKPAIEFLKVPVGLTAYTLKLQAICNLSYLRSRRTKISKGWSVPLSAQKRIAGETKGSRWDHARVSLVVPIGVIVAVAIICVVVAVLTSAQRADQVSFNHEQQLIRQAIANHGARVLQQLDSVAGTPRAVQRRSAPLTTRNGWPSTSAIGCKPTSPTMLSWSSTAPIRSNSYAFAPHPTLRPPICAPLLQPSLDLLRGRLTALPGGTFDVLAGQSPLQPGPRTGAHSAFPGPAGDRRRGGGRHRRRSELRQRRGADRLLGQIYRRHHAARHRQRSAALRPAPDRRRGATGRRRMSPNSPTRTAIRSRVLPGSRARPAARS